MKIGPTIAWNREILHSTMVLPSPTPIDYGEPTSFFVFLVGHCEEWPDNREEQGDIALRDEFLRAGVPSNQVCFLKDKQCTKANCEEELQKFLGSTRKRSTLVFYYGGHGYSLGFKTIGEPWLYAEVCSQIDSLFQGERVLYLLDCCACGNLSYSIPIKTEKSYVCLANTAPYLRASDEGEEWVINHCWLQGMRRSNIPLQLVAEFIADRLALVMGDQFFGYLSPTVDSQATDWMPRHRQAIPEKLDWPRLEKNIPSDGIVTSDWSVGDPVFYKHPGGEPANIPPSWLMGYIVAEASNGSVRVRVEWPGRPSLAWVVTAHRDQLMNDFYMGQTWMLPRRFEEAQVELARRFRYIDFSAEPCTVLKGSEHDTVLDWRDYQWSQDMDVVQDEGEENPYGPLVAVQGKEPGDQRAVPVPQKVPFLESLSSIHTDEDGVEWERNAMIEGILSADKSICNARTQFGSTKLLAFWPEDGLWYDAEPLDPDRVPLSILATHAQFTLKGLYCPLKYEDGEYALSPLHYVRRRKDKICCFVS